MFSPVSIKENPTSQVFTASEDDGSVPNEQSYSYSMVESIFTSQVEKCKIEKKRASSKKRGSSQRNTLSFSYKSVHNDKDDVNEFRKMQSS